MNLVIEVKSAKDWHLVFAGDAGKENVGHTLRIWSGIMGEREDWLRESLRRNRVPEEAVPTLVARFEAHAYPEKSALLSSIFVDTPRARTSATTFRETNIDKEKELESSVLWRAMSALRSATTSLTESVKSWHAESFDGLERKPFGSREFMEEFDAACRASVRYVDIFHPIVLIDARPWIAHASGLPRSVPTCRFHQLDPIGGVTWWCDVVHSDAFEKFADEITGHYDGFFRKRRAVRKTLKD